MTNIFTGDQQFDLSNEDHWQALVESLDPKQLKTLNGLICDRMEYLQNLDTLDSMIQFKMDEYVQFTDKSGQLQTGRITKFNRKTIGVLSLDGQKWNVSPQMLERTANPTLQKSTHPTNQPGKTRSYDWVAGCTPLPGSVNGEQGFYVPDTLLWIDGDGMVRHVAVLEPGKEAQEIVSSFETAISGPDGEYEQPPKTLRTDNEDLKRLLAPLFPDIKFILAEVPEISEVAEHMAQALENDAPGARTYQDLGISPATVAAFFEAAALLYKAEPWKHIPDEQRLLSITIEKYGINDNVITVIGQAGMHFGVLLFNTLADYERYTVIANSGDTHRLDEIPTHRVLNYIPNTEVDTEQRKEIMDNGWQVANHNAYPDLFLPVDGRIARFPDTKDLHIFETIACALLELFEKSKELKNCWQTGNQLHVVQQISTTVGVVDVSIQLPVLPAGKTLDTLNVLDKMALIDRSDFSDAKDRHDDLVEQIDKAYRRSPEFNSIREPGAGFTLVMELSFHYLDCTVATLLPGDLEELLYEVVPRKVVMDSTEADAIIDDCIAFFSFLKREYAMQNADELIACLNLTAKQSLREALDDSSKFGMGKSLFVGTDKPYEGPHGIDSSASDSTSDFTQYDPFGDALPQIKPPKSLTPAEKKNRKKNRKASRKARKKSR